MAASSDTENTIHSLDERRAKRFINQLIERPFVAIVFGENGAPTIYVRGVEPEEALRKMTELVLAMEADD